MQVADNKEEVLRGVQRLRAMAASNHALGGARVVTPCNTDLNLSMAVNVWSMHSDDSCTRPNPPVQLEFHPLRPISHRPQVAPPLSELTRRIDVNQIPSGIGCNDLPECSPSIFSSFEADPDFAGDIGLGNKRYREKVSDAEQDRTCEVSSRASDEEETGQTRKKLRLTKEQSALLEENFKENSTLNPKKKNALAKQLNLRPRQVEVWFQNRRARTKLKQTEVDCEVLKRWCESLTEENKRLQKELQELRAIKVGPPCIIASDFYMPLPAATLTMCPSCERLATTDNKTLGFPKGQMPQFSQPSAAC